MKKYRIISILALIGSVNAAYLSYHAYGFWFATHSEALHNLFCDISNMFSCSDILRNPRALIFGIPFPMIALIVYPLLGCIALSGWIRQSLTEAKVLTAISFGGICFNSYVVYQEFIVGIFCPLCAICTVIIISIFLLSIYLWRTEGRK